MRPHRFISLITTAGVALPVITTIEFLSHANLPGLGARLTSSAPAPARSTGAQGKGSGSTGTGTTPPKPARSHATGTFAGPPEQDLFGVLQTWITVSQGKITDVKISAPQDNPTSAYINQQADPLLRSETLQAQSANINGISGATITSYAYYQSLQKALSKAGI